jgi:hypothetical protein
MRAQVALDTAFVQAESQPRETPFCMAISAPAVGTAGHTSDPNSDDSAAFANSADVPALLDIGPHVC